MQMRMRVSLTVFLSIVAALTGCISDVDADTSVTGSTGESADVTRPEEEYRPARTIAGDARYERTAEGPIAPIEGCAPLHDPTTCFGWSSGFWCLGGAPRTVAPTSCEPARDQPDEASGIVVLCCGRPTVTIDIPSRTDAN